MNEYLNQRDGVFPSVCSLDCPDQCGLLVHKESGKITKVEGDPSHPVTKGSICNKVRHMTERIYDENRLTVPMKRTGPKGEGAFTPISWEEAITTITDKWKQLMEASSPESILPYGFYGNMGRLNAEGMDRRFFNKLGASFLDRTICSSAGAEGYTYTMGGGFGIDPEDTVHSKLIILWGVNAVSTNMHQMMFAQKARKNGAKIIVIDVHNNQTGRFADWFIPVKPGTDTALALGMMHILFKEKFSNEDFLQKYTIGAAQLKEHVEPYDPVTVSAITGVPVQDIYQLARDYGTVSPAFIRIGNGIQHHDHGGMCVRTIACLPAITGQWEVKGGGAIKSNLGYLSINDQALQGDHLKSNSAARTINMNELGKALSEAIPPVESLFIYSSNPALVAPDLNKVRKGLMREDLFTVVHDLFMTESAVYADILLPAASSYENLDLYTSYWHHYLQLQKPVIEPFGESKSNVEVFKLLAEGMGFTEEEFSEGEESMIRSALSNQNNPFIHPGMLEEMKGNEFVKADASLPLSHLSTPSGKIELFSEAMKAEGHAPLPTYTPPVEENDYPFTFIPGPNHSFLNSTFSNQRKHRQLEREAKLFMHSEDAALKRIKNGDSVIVWNDRGDCELTASVGNDVLPGVLVTQGLWAGSDHKVNALTPDRIADMGGGATFFSGRVNIRKS